MTAPDFPRLNQIEEQLFAARLESIRLALTHAGEKGRDLELHVRSLLRDLLPAEYGLTTGFIAFIKDGEVELTSQLDVIIYDAIRYSPLIHLQSCDVLPLEAVYGYVEVKASVRSSTASRPPADSLQALVKQNSNIRELRNRQFYSVLGGSPIQIETREEYWLAPRAYVVAFEVSGGIAKNPAGFAKTVAEAMEQHANAHIHGILVPNYGFFYTRPVDVQVAERDDYYHVKYTTDHPLLAFKTLLLQGLSSFQRAPSSWWPALDKYMEHKGQWHEQAPRSSA